MIKEKTELNEHVAQDIQRFFGHRLKTRCHFSLGFNLHDLLHVQCLPVFVRHSTKAKNTQDADLGNRGYTVL